MKVWEIRRFGLDGPAAAERPDPVPGHGQVLVAMRAASLNYRDLMIVRGQYNPRMPLPRIPCSDGVGVVEAAGPGVSCVQVGQRVAGIFAQGWLDGPITQAKARTALGGDLDGVLAAKVLLSAEGVVPVPDHLSDEQAACLPCAGVTAWNALAGGGGIKAGDTVLLLGTGGVSLFALQFAKLHGARAIITSGSDGKLARAAALGADDTVNYKAVPDWDKRVLELTGGVGVDHVVEVGGAGTIPRSIKAVRVGGRISLIGVLAGADGGFNPVSALMKSVTLQGVFVGSRADFEDMNRAVALHRLVPVVDRVFGFDEFPAALALMESAGHFGKIALRF